jgi:dihydroorotate dehydrogenase electron transfer subunit
MCKHEKVESALKEAVVSSHELVAADTWRMVLSLSLWKGEDPHPGQFLMLRVAEDSDPLLARPFGISGFTRKEAGAEVEIIYRVVGRGTGMMARWSAGRRTKFLGPLGRGFTLPGEGSSSLLVAGGVGLPPILALARKMEGLGRSGELTLVYGEANQDRLVDPEAAYIPEVKITRCTEDGSCGNRGLVTDLLHDKEYGVGHHLYICGPNPMMRAVLKLTAGRCRSAQYSLEARMACGFGVCSGCAVKLASGDYVRVCREGPVFDGNELSPDSFTAV